MDKKKQFQKQVLTSKLKEHTIILSTLEKSYNDLINSSNINITNSNNNSTLTNQNSITIDKLNKLNVLTILQQDKSSLENNKKTIKQAINNLTTTISQLEYNLKQLPLDTKNILTKEINILNDEHQRIENDRLETINNNIESITKANLDKEELLKDIELLKVTINLQANVITNIQKESHSSRKNILESLKEKKQLKIKLNNTIENATINVNTFIQQIHNLNNEIDNLIEFKKILVNCAYENNTDNNTDTDTNTDTNTDLESYHKLYNIDNNILLNEKLNKIDDIITNNKKQILLFNKNLSKTETINNYTIQDTINNYYTTNSNKVLTYKDTFKLEKEKQTQLERILDNKLTLYNNYQTLIIDKINNEFKSKIECLNLDKLNADKRLHIIKLRMNKEYENKKKELKKQIEDTKQEMQNQNEYIQTINNNIKIVTTTIEKTTVINDELYILENKIKKHKEIISITEKDLTIITNH